MQPKLFDSICWSADGLLPVVSQDEKSGEVLMVAWMNAAALQKTIDTGEAHYWSRSRQCLWRKGETSGHTQHVREIRLDCDGDTLLLKVHQHGPACHTGNRNCFFQVLDHGVWRSEALSTGDASDSQPAQLK